MKMAENTFNISDYDCIGFDLDNTLARYKIEAMVEIEYQILAKSLVQKGYSEKHLMKPIDFDFLLRGLVLDVDNGNVMKLAADGKIISATHGTRLLSKDELEEYYPNSHWKLSDSFVKDPSEIHNGPNSDKIHFLLDYFDTVFSLVFARLVDNIDEETKEPILKYNVFTDIHEGFVNMLAIANSERSEGSYIKELKANPDKYYRKSSENLKNWLKKLRKQGKLLYLLSNAHIDFASTTASFSLGPNWKDYFDIIITNGKKPGFFTLNRNFTGLNGFEEAGPISAEELALQSVYSNGNWKDLHEFLVKHHPKANPKFLYVGDNVIADIYTPNFYSCCDTIVICEELAGENHHDEKTLGSTFWGSYFQDKQVDTIWYSIMKDHAINWFSDMDALVNLSCNTK